MKTISDSLKILSPPNRRDRKQSIFKSNFYANILFDIKNLLFKYKNANMTLLAFL